MQIYEILFTNQKALHPTSLKSSGFYGSIYKNLFKIKIMLEYKGIKYNITYEPQPNKKGRLFQYSINFEPLKKLNASTFQEAKKIVEKLIDKL